MRPCPALRGRGTKLFTNDSAITVRRLKPEEVKAWEEQAEANRDTLIFIRGMLEIGAKAHAERGCVV